MPGGPEPLDRTGIHPESYKETKALLKTAAHCGSDRKRGRKEKISALPLSETAEELGIGEITLADICGQLTERDPRDEVPKPLLKKTFCSLRI